ncbi:MAG: hypothetical protein V2G42_07975 [bacterium JZ-2024 1]
MNRVIRAILASLIIASPAYATTASPGLGNGWVNTPVAWNLPHGWWGSLSVGTRKNDLAGFLAGAGLYSTYDLEFFGGVNDAGDPADITTYGVGARWNGWRSSGFAFTVIGSVQRTKARTESNSDMVATAVAGFEKGDWMLNAFASIHSDVGRNSQNVNVGDDWQVGGNLSIKIVPDVRLFGEWYSYFDADRQGYAAGVQWDFQPTVSALAAIDGVQDPFKEARFLFNLNFAFQ